MMAPLSRTLPRAAVIESTSDGFAFAPGILLLLLADLTAAATDDDDDDSAAAATAAVVVGGRALAARNTYVG